MKDYFNYLLAAAVAIGLVLAYFYHDATVGQMQRRKVWLAEQKVAREKAHKERVRECDARAATRERAEKLADMKAELQAEIDKLSRSIKDIDERSARRQRAYEALYGKH